MTPPGCYGGQGEIHKQVPVPADQQSIVSVPWESHERRVHSYQPLSPPPLLLIPSLPSLIAQTISFLLPFPLSFYLSPLPCILTKVKAEMFNRKRDCTVSFSVWVCQIRLEAPFSQTHPELGLQQKPPPERQRDPLCIPSSSCTRLGYRSCHVLGSWFSCCGGERLGLLPDSSSLSRESRRVCLPSPLHPSHTHARSHTLTHTLAMLLLLLLLLLRSVALLPFDGSLTLTLHKPSMCILAVHTGTYTDSPLHSC